MAMIGTPTQACIQQAFSNRTLMGLGLLDGFESGCGCGDLALGGLGATEYGDTGSGEGEAPPKYSTGPKYTTGNPCDDTSLWALRMVNGKCWNYCTADISQQYEAHPETCAVGGNTVGKVKPKTLDMNTMMIIGIGLAAFVLARQ